MSASPLKTTQVPVALQHQTEQKLRHLPLRQQALVAAYAKGLHAGYVLASATLRKQRKR